MLGHDHARRRHHEGNGGGNIERAKPVAAGAAQIHGALGRAHGAHMGAHGAGRADQFLHGGAAVGGSSQVQCQFFVAQTAFEDFIEQFLGLRCVQRLFRRRKECGLAHAVSLRKLASRAWPFSEAMLSG